MHPLQAGTWNAAGVTLAKNGLLLLGIEYIKQVWIWISHF
jgi:hypothetical protein